MEEIIAFAIVLLIMFVFGIIIYYDQSYNPYFNSNIFYQVPIYEDKNK